MSVLGKYDFIPHPADDSIPTAICGIFAQFMLNPRSMCFPRPSLRMNLPARQYRFRKCGTTLAGIFKRGVFFYERDHNQSCRPAGRAVSAQSRESVFRGFLILQSAGDQHRRGLAAQYARSKDHAGGFRRGGAERMRDWNGIKIVAVDHGYGVRP